MNSKLIVQSAGVVAVVIGITAFWLIGTDKDDMANTSSGDSMAGMNDPRAQNQGARQPLYWVAPMDANYRRDEPGLSPMGMPLIPVYEAGDTITVPASIQQNLGVRTAVVVRQDFTPIIDAVAYTGWDESGIEVLYTRAEGWLEVLNMASVGDSVQAGDVLYELFAPNLVSVQREYLTARESGNLTLTAVAKDRLRALGFTEEQVATLDRTSAVRNRLEVRARRDAVITHINVRPGNYVQPSTPIATLASLDKVWLETEVFESETSWIEVGRAAIVSFAAFPGEIWNTSIAYIYPNLEATTRSLRLRMIVDNADHRLLPNMFASVQIASKPRLHVLTVPREAVIRAGAGNRVISALGEGRFQPRVVRTGVVSGGKIEIISGLNEGDVVVTSGQFLLDSEANGEQAFARLSASDDSAESQAGMNMDMPAVRSPNVEADSDANNSEVTDANSADPIFGTSGVVRQVVAGSTVTIAHQPVEALGWPSMTMAFQIPSQMNIGDLAVGDAVMFEFVQTAQGGYQLTMIMPQGDRQ